jgi:hypothetical protein
VILRVDGGELRVRRGAGEQAEEDQWSHEILLCE